MAEAKKKILVVDDHFEMLEFLRSMLELSDPNCQVSGVPSAEEGLLELHRTPFDLLISDVRLPGMSGFELARKARRLREGLPVLMITAYASAQGRKEAEQLGVTRYFEKPLDTDALLAAVHAAVYGQTSRRAADTAPFMTARTQKEQAPAEAAQATEPPRGPTIVSAQATADDLLRRLQALLSDTGAVEVLLAGAEGQILYRAGNSDQPVVRLAKLLARSLQQSFELAEALQSTEPFTIQYQAGERADVYAANIDRRYFIILLFDARARRGRIGTVWVFAQRAVKEMRALLPEVDAQPPSQRGSERGTVDAAAPVESAPQPPTRTMERGGGVTGAEHRTEVDAAQDDLFDLLERAEAEEALDLDSFWDEAAANAGGGGSGLSYEEAVRRGLLPPDLGS